MNTQKRRMKSQEWGRTWRNDRPTRQKFDNSEEKPREVSIMFVHKLYLYI